MSSYLIQPDKLKGRSRVESLNKSAHYTMDALIFIALR